MRQKVQNPNQAIGAELFPLAGVDADEAAAAMTPEQPEARQERGQGQDLELGFPRYLIAVNTVGGQIPNPGEIRDADMQGKTKRYLGNIELRLVESPAHYVAVCNPAVNDLSIWSKEEYATWAKANPGMLTPYLDRSSQDRRLPYIVHDMGDYAALWPIYDAEGDGCEAVSKAPEIGLRTAAKD